MADTLRWGVLGNATIARVCVVPAIQRSRNGRVHVLGTRRPDQAAPLAEQYGISHVTDTYDAVLADPQVDAVYIPLPNHLHHPWCLKAISAGKHVLCEKPLSCNADQAGEMVAAAEDAGLWLMEALMYRFHPRSQKIKELVDQGVLGRLRLVRAAFTFAMDSVRLAASEEVRLKPEMGGGALLDVGCYGVSMARWLLARPPSAVQAAAIRHPGGVDLQLVGTMCYDDDALAVVEAGFMSALQQTITVAGTRGAIETPHNTFVPWHKEATFTLRTTDQEKGQVHRIPGVDEYQLMVEHFADAVKKNRPTAISTAESIENMHVLDALADAARTGLSVNL